MLPRIKSTERPGYGAIIRAWIAVVLPAVMIAGCAWQKGDSYQSPSGDVFISRERFRLFRSGDWPGQAQRLLSSMDLEKAYPTVSITTPLDGSVFPADLAAPAFSWHDGESRRWLLVFSSGSPKERIVVLTDRNRWTPAKETWEMVKTRWTGQRVDGEILGIGHGETAVSRGRIVFTVSRDPVDAPILYQEMPLPFSYAFDNTHLFRWRMGDLSAYAPPKTVLKNPPSCMFCHAFSGNGKTFGMDLDYKGDKGGYILTDIAPDVRIDPKDIISWNRLKMDSKVPSMGLFSKISRDGRFVVSTVNEKPFMITMNHVDFSQLFFPLTGSLAVYDRQGRRFFPLRGADRPDFVQTSPEWSPDGKFIVFARAPVDERLKKIMGPRRLLIKNSTMPITKLNKLYRIRYNLYTVPFNDGLGGDPTPVKGASFNGTSNYFPRVSPDGKWIVFNRSDTGIVAQPTSTLYIVPFHGGKARRMTCNTRYYNSWHSWSPNGRWLVFTSKVNTAYTQLFITHVDDQGMDSPPVLLSRLHRENRAAVIPEFVNIAPKDLNTIRFAAGF